MWADGRRSVRCGSPTRADATSHAFSSRNTTHLFDHATVFIQGRMTPSTAGCTTSICQAQRAWVDDRLESRRTVTSQMRAGHSLGGMTFGNPSVDKGNSGDEVIPSNGALLCPPASAVR